MTEHIVKSAKRVLDILEYFATIRRAARVSDVVAALDYPQSSTSVLLNSLVQLGYLEYLSDTRRFRPTLRVNLLGDWIGVAMFSERLTERIDALQRTTQETILLGRRQGAELQYVFATVPKASVALVLPPGLRRPMSRTALGRVLLSSLPEGVARRIIRRNSADEARPEYRVDENRLIAELKRIRVSGFGESDSYATTPEAHVIAAALPVEANAEPLAIGVGGPSARILGRRQEIMDAISQWLGKDPIDVVKRPTPIKLTR